MLLAGLVPLTYTVTLGRYGVAYPDACQFGIFLLGNIVLIPILLAHTGGLDQVHRLIELNCGSGAESFFTVIPRPPGLGGLGDFLLSPSGWGRRLSHFPAQTHPLAKVVGQAGPQRLTAHLLQTPHPKLPQPDLGFQPGVGKLGHGPAQPVKGSCRGPKPQVRATSICRPEGWCYGSLTSRRVPTTSLIYVEEGKGIVKRISFPRK